MRVSSNIAAPERPPSATVITPAAGPLNVSQAKSTAGPDTVARQVGRILAARSTGVESARAVTGIEQTVAAKGPTGSTQPGQQAAKSNRQPSFTGRGSESTESRTTDPAQRSDFDRLVRSVRLNLGGTRSTARLRLDPPELGRIDIEARLDGQRLELLVRTETNAAGELLRSRVAQLRTALGQHGLWIDRFDVTLAGASEQQSLDGGTTTREQDSSQPPPGGDAHGGRTGDQRQASAGTEPSLSAGDQTDGYEQEQPSAGSQAAVAATGAAGEMRLDVRV